MSPMGRHKFDAAVVVPVVVSADKGPHPLAPFDLVAKRPAGATGRYLIVWKRDYE